MKLAFINHWPPNTGVGAYIFSLFSNFKRYKIVDADMFCTGFHPIRISTINKKVTEGIIFLHEPHFCRNPYIISLFKHVFSPHRIPQSYHLYHVSDEMIARFTKFNCPSVITIHGPLTFTTPKDTMALGSGSLGAAHYLRNIFLQSTYRNIVHANKIICVSESSKRNLLATLAIDPEKIKVIYYGMDHQLFKPRDKMTYRKKIGLPLDKIIVLNVGNESHSKNIPTLIKAFYKIKKRFKNAILVRVGDQLPSTKELVDRFGPEGFIHFKRVPHQYISYFYNSADLFVFPSLREGFGFPALEAMASGCPLIASNRPAVPEIVGNGGVLIDPLDVDSLALQMETVLKDENLRAELIKKGIKRALTFTWEKCAKETYQIYKEVLYGTC